MLKFTLIQKENTLHSRLTIYSIFLILVTTFSAMIGTVILEIYQTGKDHEILLHKSIEGFKIDFSNDIKYLDKSWKKFSSDPIRTNNILSAILFHPSDSRMPEEFTNFGSEINAEELSFYFPIDDEDERLHIYYNRELSGTIVTLSERQESDKILYINEADGRRRQIEITQPLDVPDLFVPPKLKHEIEIWKGQPLVKSHLFYANTSFEDMAIEIEKGKHIGDIILRRKTSFSILELERRLGVHLTLFDLAGNAMEGSIPIAAIPPDTITQGNPIQTIRNAQGESFNTLLAPIHYQNDVIGYVSAAISQDDIYQRVQATVLVLLLIALFVIILGIVISGVLIRRISAPLTELSKVFGEYIHSENISVELLNEKMSAIHKLPSFLRGREFRNLQKSFLKMMEVVEKQTDTITEQNQSLEQKISEIRQKNEELREMDRLKDEFMANTSHELRTPIHGIIGLAESMLVSEKLEGFDLETQHLKMIISSGRRLNNLINDILDFYKMREYGIRLQFEPLFLRSLVDAILSFTAPLIGEKPIELINQIPSDLPPVYADESRLEQILYNLVSNAIKFTEKGSVIISGNVEGEKIILSVYDTGIGIPKNRQKDIFEIFTQVDGSIARKSTGTGIGLSIVKSLVELHQGSINLASEEGLGSHFSFDLPIAQTPPDGALTLAKDSNLTVRKDIIIRSDKDKPGIPLSLALTQDNYSILVIDDEPVNREILKTCLTDHGYLVVLASSGEQALHYMEENKPDLVLLDLMMPQMSGYQVCQNIREKWDLVTLPVIILSAKNQLSDLEEGFLAGANDYLTKPFHIREILSRVNTQLMAKECVDQILENKRLQEEIRTREKLEHKLKIAQKRLIQILDIKEDAIISLNQSHSIVFFNHRAEKLFGYSANEVIGEPMSLLFSEDTILNLMSSQKDGDFKKSVELQVLLKNQNPIKTVSYLSRFSIEEETLITILLPSQTPVFDSEPTPLSLQTSRELSTQTPQTLDEQHIIDRISALEKAVSVVFQRLPEKADPPLSLPEVSESDNGKAALISSDVNFRKLIVDLMNQSLEYWETGTGKTKVELAQESNIWAVQIDGGTCKTRTLNRYLRLEQLPKRPRVREVLRTVNYVLNACPVNETLKTELEQNKTVLLHTFKS